MIALVFAVTAIGIGLVRFRDSPLYPRFNDVNSDVFVYQMVGNSWLSGRLPYQDVYDVKGPALLLLFRFFAEVRPWSMGPPLATLVLLAFASLWLAYAIARVRLEQRSLAAFAAAVSCVLIYLTVTQVPTSFTCEELAIPGVLLLLWLVTRWLRGEVVGPGWLVADGVAFGVLFWAKYQVIAPWAAMAVALTIVGLRRGLSGLRPGVGRVVALHLAGAAIATAVIVPFYLPVLPDLLRAYFLAKAGGLDLADELPKQVEFVTTAFGSNTAAALTLVAVLVVLVLGAVRRASRDGLSLALAVAFCLASWASTALVRHPNNLFVPLSFCAVAVPQVIAAARSRGRVATGAAVGGLAALTAAACVAPLAQGVASYRLFRAPRSMTCYQLPSLERSTVNKNVSTVFASAAGHQPILSVGTLFAARSSFISGLPMTEPFQFVDNSWARSVGADRVQAEHLQNRTFDYVWIHIAGVDRFKDLEAQIAAATYTKGPSQPVQAAALVRNYVPVLSCNNEILLRTR